MRAITTSRGGPDRAPRRPMGQPVGEPVRSLLRHRLTDLERRLVDMAEATERRLRAAGTASPVLACLRPDATVLAEVRAALARFASGHYGLCTDCGAPVGLERLVARPQVDRCADCDDERAPAAGRGRPS